MSSEIYPKYLDYRDVPVKQMTRFAVPEIYRGRGVWEPFTDTGRLLTESQVVDEEKFKELVNAWDDSLEVS